MARFTFFPLVGLLLHAPGLLNAAGHTYRLDLQRCTAAGPWVVEGLRPQWLGEANCSSGPAFDPTELSAGLYTQLVEHWPSCSGSGSSSANASEAAWAAAWSTEGRCTGLDESSYFNNTITVAQHNAKYCTSDPSPESECFFCFNDEFKPIARSDCLAPKPPGPGPPKPTPSTRRAFHLQLEKCKGSDQWSIHGLWPEWGENCNGTAFDLQALSDIEGALNVSWRTCPEYNSSISKFWGHEWSTHGTCSGLTEHGYFSTTLDLFKKHVASCPAAGESDSCWFCFDAGNLTLIDNSQCHFTPGQTDND